MELKWNPSLSVGEKIIDNQHKKLLNQINKLKLALESPKLDIGYIREANHFLYNYFREHFTYEEEYMLKNNFPGLEKHKKTHQSFIDFYDTFQLEFRKKLDDKFFSTIEIKDLIKKIKVYLNDWLINHIKGNDQIYAKYIQTHSI
ncbi:MAG: bacteriohemerythrin [Nanoarchaeota archaeon]|nr:bacteriohemerythrin [Nanoarchaeota archaeon]MBU4242464.1 bacteriohemerythrin [Nanoarchaeota archaeon]MBU4352007.1 bacteriohemerythrin [Nanoarchaeota archaeon]MBU4456810.1 bacteriohemerythrin [Nanoarchaeota archaeon]MCG2719392.1 bacteriohemerythrin [Nanoarchaeota archaeon]